MILFLLPNCREVRGDLFLAEYFDDERRETAAG